MAQEMKSISGFVLAVALLAGCVSTRPAHVTQSDAIEAVWNATVSGYTVPEGVKLRDVADNFEVLSRKLDPSGRGIRIVCQRFPDDWAYDKVDNTIRLTERTTLHDMVKFVGEWGHCEVRFVSDVAIFCRRQDMGRPVYRVAPVRGSVVDDASGAPVTNVACLVKPLSFCDWGFLVGAWDSHSENPPPDVTQGSTLRVALDGTFGTEVFYTVRRPYVMGIGLYEDQDDTVDLVFTSPSYKARTIRVCLGDTVTPMGRIAVRLERDKPDANIGVHGSLTPQRGSVP